ncbi:hypothetical protein PG5_19870 [Pseudomonas sp. G5(2012)]|nr:hypothetical protein PG5_19870 [Pseudomonas sp. G5(2012)]
MLCTALDLGIPQQLLRCSRWNASCAGNSRSIRKVFVTYWASSRRC